MASLKDRVFHRPEAFERVFVNGVDPNEPDWDHKGRTPLFEAALRYNGVYLKELLEVGADPNVTTPQGETVLHVVLQNHPVNTDIVHQLLDTEKLHLDQQENLSGLSPLHILARMCVSNGNSTNIHLHEALQKVASQCNVNLLSNRNETPLHRAASGNRDNVRVASVLVKCGADINVQNDCGLTPLLCSIDKGNVGIASFLISAGADVNLPDRYGQTALHYAAQRGLGDLVCLIITRDGCEVNAVDSHRDTALHLAVGKGYLDVVHLLLSHPDVEGNRRNGKGNTPLHSAIQGGFTSVVKALLQSKCNLYIRTINEKTALELADDVRDRGTYLEIRKLILVALQMQKASWDKMNETFL